jgi:hypothetical protein
MTCLGGRSAIRRSMARRRTALAITSKRWTSACDRTQPLIGYLRLDPRPWSVQAGAEVSGGSLSHRLPAAGWCGSLMVCARRAP